MLGGSSAIKSGIPINLRRIEMIVPWPILVGGSERGILLRKVAVAIVDLVGLV